MTERLDLYHDLTHAIETGLWDAAVIDCEDGTMAIFPAQDGTPCWVTPDKVIAAIAGRVMAVFQVHARGR